MIKFLYKVLDFAFVTVIKLVGICPGGKVVPSCAARNFWVWCNNSNAVLYNIVPILNILWIAFSYKEYNG